MGDDIIRREIVIEAKTEKLDTLLTLLRGDMEQAGCPFEKQTAFEICVEEIFVNIAHYAYQGKDGKAYITAQTEKDRITICLKDKGMPYDPLKKEDPDLTLSAQERPVGGLGIFMVKTMMDDVSYEYKDGSNCLTMTMLWQSGQDAALDLAASDDNTITEKGSV